MYTTRIHWVVWGTGTPKDKDEVNKDKDCFLFIMNRETEI
jgi:hypothetical protein